FFRGSVHVCHLHSFPTRRSSDLSQVIRYTALMRSGRDLFVGQALGFVGLVFLIASLSHGQAPAPNAPGRFRDAAPLSHFPYITRDRKSTRLNSSHLGISYAVFCL